ncbi:MAG: hypothetical protein Q4D80_02030 [Pseudomonadota bacterium]|nr:hypothetical protein [Pseudomonadota bacterium]
MKNYLAVLFFLLLTGPSYAARTPPLLLDNDGMLMDDSEDLEPSENIENSSVPGDDVLGLAVKDITTAQQPEAESQKAPVISQPETKVPEPAAETAEAGETPAEGGTEETPEAEPVEYLPNPSNFSADFMSSLYECKPAKEQQNLSGFEEIAIMGPVAVGCRLRYEQFILTVPTGLLPNIHSMADIRQLLQNGDISKYQPQYEYTGLLQELNVCIQNTSSHNAYLHRRTKNEITITSGLTSKIENGGCTVRLLNQLNIGEKFADYSVVCKIPADDMQLILDAYKDLLAEEKPKDEDLKKADDEIMFRLQQVGYCHKPKI